MINKSISLLVFYIFIIASNNLILLPSYLIGKKDTSINYIKKILQSMVSFMLCHIFKTNIYYSNLITLSEDNKIDIIISNHMATFDFIVVLSILNQMGIHHYNMVTRRGMVYYPFFGSIIDAGRDIKLNRKWMEDERPLQRSVSKLKSGVIVMFPEGTRFTLEKQIKADQFCTERGIPLYQNTLCPRTKGMWKIISELRKQNKLGKLYDLSLTCPKFKKQPIYIDKIMKYGMGDIFVMINQIQLPSDEIIFNMDKFKYWFYYVWHEKDKRMNYYNQLIYQKVERTDFEYITELVCIILVSIKLTSKYKGKDLAFFLVVSYLIIMIRKFFYTV